MTRFVIIMSIIVPCYSMHYEFPVRTPQRSSSSKILSGVGQNFMFAGAGTLIFTAERVGSEEITFSCFKLLVGTLLFCTGSYLQSQL